MTAGIVIPCRNEATTLGPLLEAIAAQSRVPDQVIVVDDGSTDGSAAVARGFASAHPLMPLTVIDGPSRGVAAAVNAGVRALTTDLVVRLDGHCRPRAEYLSRTAAWLSDRAVGVVGGVWRIEPGASTSMARAISIAAAHPLGAGGAAYRQADVAQAADVDTVPFGGFRRELWHQLNGLDESLLANEDYEFNYRVRRSGQRVVIDPSIESVYLARPTLGALARQYGHYGFWKQRMLARHPESVRLRQVAPAALVPVMTAAVLFSMAAPMFLAIPGLYLASVALVSMQASLAAGAIGLGGRVAMAFVTMHWSWSVGFWKGAFGRRAHRREAR